MDYEVHYEEQAREAEELRRKEQLRVAELKFPIARYTNLLNISSYMLVQWDGRYLCSTFLTLIRLFLCSDFSTASTGPAAVAVEFPRLTCVNAFAGNRLRWILESVAVLAFGITSQMADETLATKLIIKPKFGVGHAAYYIQASSPQLFATWGTGIPFLPIDQEVMLECILEAWPAGATGTPVPFSSLTEEQALRLRPCLEATLGVDAPNTGKENAASSLTCCQMACSKNLRVTRTRRNMAAAAAAAKKAAGWKWSCY